MIVKPLDLETSIFNKGNFADRRNDVCFIGIGENVYEIAYADNPYGEALKAVQQEIDEADLLVLINAKFDLHHLKNLGIKFNHKRIWDCQVVEFMLNAQTTPYPSMNGMAEKYGLPQKPDIKEKYWENDIDTKQIPRDEIVSYLKEHDLTTTKAIYEIQRGLVTEKPVQFQRLVSLANQDLLVLEEMEYNGIYFDEELCLAQAEKLKEQINSLRMELHDYHNIEEFNTESGDHLSCLIYGGTITIPRKEIVGVYKTGDRKGEEKYGWKDYSYTLPRLFNPLPKSELKKPGFYATGEDILRQLKSKDKAAKRVIEIILSLAKMEKMVGTYYQGLPKLRETMNWQPNILHGQLNMCMARTGRLSSSKPNLQNLAGDMKFIFKTRFNND
jgi:DNA polymerase I-like protein with 3'-5' exonuclease and polymerase domains